jgi:hypothetical protein
LILSSIAAEERLRGIAIEIYKQYSMIPSVSTTDTAPPNSSLSFDKFGRKILIDHWLDPSYVHDILFHDLGRIIGLSERKYFIDQLAKNVSPQRMDISLGLIEQSAAEMAESHGAPTAILLPIELYQKVHANWDPSWRTIRYNPDRFVFADTQIRIFWSNMYTPFKIVYLVAPSFGIWTTRRPKDERLEVLFNPQSDTSMEVTVQTVFNFQVRTAEAVRAFEIPNLPEMPS